MHENEIVRIHRGGCRDQAVVHRVAPRLATAVQRLDAPFERTPVVASELLVARRENDEHVLGRRGAQRAHRMPQHRLAEQRQVLFRSVVCDSGSGTGGSDQGEQGQSKNP